MAKARRTVMYSAKGKKLYAVRDKAGKFKDIQQYSRAHAMDIKRTSKDEAAAKKAVKKRPKKAVAKKTAKGPARKTVKRAVKTTAKRAVKKAVKSTKGRARKTTARKTVKRAAKKA